MFQSEPSHRLKGATYNGLEIGSVSVKLVGMQADGTTHMQLIRHEGNPQQVVKNLIAEIKNLENSRTVITGQAAKACLDFPYRAETECIEKALQHYQLTPDILLSLGGESFMLYTLKNGEVKNLYSSSKCAAGTGEFIIQQLQRMGLSLEEGIEKSYQGRLIQLASRCSVYCKSDATHKLNKGECQPADIAYSLIHNLADRVWNMVEASQWEYGNIIISGGIALNTHFLKMLQEKVPMSKIQTIQESPLLEAFGAALHASEFSWGRYDATKKEIKEKSLSNNSLGPLQNYESLLDYRVRKSRHTINANKQYLLGIDAGSTTTKAVLFNIEDYTIDASCYLRTLGNPVKATQECLNELIRRVGNADIKVCQAATTGSGREIVSLYLSNCLSFNEILTHARAASEEIHDVDTVFEIGGQDSKFISFIDGVPIDYAMNEGCSAGTGSFLEESVSIDMGIPVEKISQTAMMSKNPAPFGERCAAFINSDLRNAIQQGISKEDVVAGLVYSIAKNYITRLVGMRPIGKRLIFQGGVALNKSVALAIAALTHQNVVVPSYPGLMGCIGACLMLHDRLKKGEIQSVVYDIRKLSQGRLEEKGTFTCSACANKCEIHKIMVANQVFPFGGLCTKYENLRKTKAIQEGQDFIEKRNILMLQEFGPTPKLEYRGTIGLPMALTTYEFFPFYVKMIEALGYKAVMSSPSREGYAKARGPMCYPCQIAHGAVYNLIQQNVDFILLPNVIDGPDHEGYPHTYICLSSNAAPSLIRFAFPEQASRLLTPQIGFSSKHRKAMTAEVVSMAAQLGIDAGTATKAAKQAMAHYSDFRKKYEQYCRKTLEAIQTDKIIIVTGKPYMTCSAEANIAISRKITSRGYHAVPDDMLPMITDGLDPRNSWYFGQKIMNAVRYAKRHENMNICIMSPFSCITNASLFHLYRRELAGKIFCYLEIDAHTAHAGFETRVGAFFDILESAPRAKPQTIKAPIKMNLASVAS